MPWERYAFCAFIFVLIYVGMFLFRMLFKPEGGKTDPDAIRERALAEERLRAMAARLDHTMNAFEEHIERQNKRLNLEVLDFAKNLDAMDELIARLEHVPDAQAGSPPPPELSAPSGHEDKAEVIKAMSRRGMSHEQIAKRLGIPIGAVSMIIGLDEER